VYLRQTTWTDHRSNVLGELFFFSHYLHYIFCIIQYYYFILMVHFEYSVDFK